MSIETMTATLAGAQTRTDQSLGAIRSSKTGEVIVGQAHGRYYEAAQRGKLFASYVAAQTLTTVNTTYTGNLVYNPIGSGVNLVLHKIGLIVSVTSATMTGIALATSLSSAAPTSVTAADRQGNLLVGGAVGAALAYKAATLAVAGTSIFPLMHNTAAIATTGVDILQVDLEGSIIIQPGYTAHLAALGAASAASAVTSSIIWEEVPVIS